MRFSPNKTLVSVWNSRNVLIFRVFEDILFSVSLVLSVFLFPCCVSVCVVFLTCVSLCEFPPCVWVSASVAFCVCLFVYLLVCCAWLVSAVSRPWEARGLSISSCQFWRGTHSLFPISSFPSAGASGKARAIYVSAFN